MEKFEFATGSTFVGYIEQDCVLLFKLSKKPVVQMSVLFHKNQIFQEKFLHG